MNEDRQKEALASIIATRDPLVMDSIGPSLSSDKDEAGGYIYFDGTKTRLSESADMLAAFYLLPCVLGADCSSEDSDLQFRCASGAACYSSRLERVATEFAGGDAEKARRIQDLAQKMGSAIEDGNISKFFPEK